MEKTGILGKIFPAKYDFYKMLEDQAQASSVAVDTLLAWLGTGGEAEEKALSAAAEKADAVRKELERKLIEAFSTPFDRGDLYYISVTMYKSLDYVKSTLASMKAFAVAPDGFIRGMAEKLKLGAETFAASVGKLKVAPEKAELLIPPLRAAHAETEQLYRDGMCAVFGDGDAMEALRHREIYHHLKDASKYLDNAVDVLHRIIVRLT